MEQLTASSPIVVDLCGFRMLWHPQNRLHRSETCEIHWGWSIPVCLDLLPRIRPLWIWRLLGCGLDSTSSRYGTLLWITKEVPIVRLTGRIAV